MIVEFVGIPGSGKSTVVRALSKRLEAEASYVALPFAAVERVAVGSYLARRPGLAWRLATRVRSGRSAVMAGAVARREHRRWTIRARDGLILMDEGPAKGVAMFAMTDARDPLGMCRVITAPDLLVMLETDPEVAARRTVERLTGGDGDQYSPARTATELQQFAEVVRAVVERARCEVMWERSHGLVSEVAGRIADRVSALQ